MANKLRTELHLTARDQTRAPLERMRQNFERSRKALDNMREEQDRNKRSIQGLIQALDWEAKTAGKTRLEIDLLKAAQMGATKADLAAIRAKHASIVANEAMGRSTRYAHANLRMLRGGVGQLGHQVQDIAIQLQMGTNGLIVFGQQGAQIASLFGPGGALLGAVIGVGAAIGTSLLPNLFQTKDGLEELGEKITSAAGGIDNLTEEMREWVQLSNAIKMQQLGDQLLEQNRGIDAQFKKIQDLNRVLESLFETGEMEGEEGAIARYSSQLDEAQQEMQRLGAEAGLTKAQISALSQAMDELESAGAEGGTETDEGTPWYIQRLLDHQDYAAMQEDVEAARLAMVEEMQNAELQQLQDHTDLLASVEAARLEMLAKQAEEEREIQEKTAELAQSAMDSMASSLQSNVQIMSQAFAQGSAIGKAFMALQQGMAVASAIMNANKAAVAIEGAYAEQAILNPLMADSLIAKGKLMANITRASGYAAAGAIAGQALASFEGGGYTGDGARAGGLDGKGGYMAMLHPRETVIDHTKSPQQVGGSQVNVSFTIVANDTRDFDRLLQSRRGMISSMITKSLSDQGKRL